MRRRDILSYLYSENETRSVFVPIDKEARFYGIPNNTQLGIRSRFLAKDAGCRVQSFFVLCVEKYMCVTLFPPHNSSQQHRFI